MRNPRRPRSLSFLSTVTESTLALLGPRSLQARTFLTSISSPSRIASTAPSGRFLTHPSTLLALATSLIEALNSTPWTMPRTTTLSATLPIEPHLGDRLCDLDYPLPYEGDSNRSDEKCGYPGKGLSAVHPQQPLNQLAPTEYDECEHGVESNHHECD